MCISGLTDIPYDQPLTVQDLGYEGESDAIDNRFRYWRLRYLLALSDEDVSLPVSSSGDRSTGVGITAVATVEGDTAAIELSARIDAAIKKLAKLDAAIASGNEVSSYDSWTTLASTLYLYRTPSGKRSATYGGIKQTKHQLIRIAIDVSCNYGDDFPAKMSSRLETEMESSPEEWSLPLRLELSDVLRSAGVDTPWYQETLAALEANATTESISLRLNEVADLARRCALDGDVEKARGLAVSLFPMAFGIGYRKDYQFTSWVFWLGRALAETGGDRFVPEAAWLARLLTASDEMSERASGLAATELPAAIVPACPISALRVFEHLVRCGTVHHLDALASLIRALVTEMGADEAAAVTLAANLTADMIAPSANHAYPQLASAVVAKYEKITSFAEASQLANSVANRTDKYALPTTRASWRRALGFEDEHKDSIKTEDTRSDEAEYGALMLSDGTKIARADVPARAKNVNDIISLHKEESDRSFFDWSTVLSDQRFEDSEIVKLWKAFGGDSHGSQKVRITLAEGAEKNANFSMALRFAYDSLETASGDSWSRHHGGMRWRAARIILRHGDADAHVNVCRNFVHQLTKSEDLPSLLLSDLDMVAETLDPTLSAAAMWPEIRTYLDGMSETLVLPEEGLLTDLRCRWWLSVPSKDWRMPSQESTASAALAEMVVGHLSHPTWLLRYAATKLVAEALGVDNREVVGALVRFAQPDGTDEILECAGRCIAAARVQYAYRADELAEPLEHILANHRSQVIRNLASDQSPREYRVLSQMYNLTLPAPADDIIGSKPVILEPYVEDYRLLANALEIQSDTIMSIAARYASEEWNNLPQTATARQALESSYVKHTYPSYELAASRAAFGRVLADIADACLLDGVPPSLRRRLSRTTDVELLTRSPKIRPIVFPGPPGAGHGQSIERWRSEVECRLEKYMTKATNRDRVLIGAKVRQTVLNWGHLHEEFMCGTTVGTGKPHGEQGLVYRESAILRDLVATPKSGILEEGTPLVFETFGARFYQLNANWIAFRPDLAVALNWKSDSERPGVWQTSCGDLAVESMWWVDGWWGRGGPAFDDTEADGHAVILTSAGLSDIVEKVGLMTQHFKLVRRGWENGVEVSPVSAKRSVPVSMQPAHI